MLQFALPASWLDIYLKNHMSDGIPPRQPPVGRRSYSECPVCLQVLLLEKLKRHMEREHSLVEIAQFEPIRPESGQFRCKRCRAMVLSKAKLLHKCKKPLPIGPARSIHTLSGGGGPGTGKRR